MNKVKKIFKSLLNFLKEIFKILLGIISIPFIPITFIGILGKTVFNKVYNSSKGIDNSVNTIKNDFFDITKILYLPIRLLGVTGGMIYNKSKNFGSFVTKQFNKAQKNVKRKFHELFPSFNRRKFERLKRHLFINKNETFLNTNMHRVVVVSTIGLQCISFFTTFRGTLSFFEGIHWVAPIAFTCVLQGVLLILSNVAFSKKRRLSMRTMLLAFLCIISMCLSYVGIANSALPPTDDYEKEYDKFSTKYNEIYEELERENIDGNAENQLQKIYTSIDSVKSYASSSIESLNLNKIDLSDIEQYEYRKTTNQYTGEPEYIRIQTQEYTDAVSFNNDLSTAISNINSKVQGLDYTYLQQNIKSDDIKDIINNNTLQTYITSHNNIVVEYQRIILKYNLLASYLNNNYDADFELYSESFTDIVTFNVIGDLDKLKLEEFDSIADAADKAVEEIDKMQTNRPDGLYELLLGGSNRAVYNDKVMLITKTEIDEKYEAMGNTLSALNDSRLNNLYSGKDNSLTKIKNELNLYNSYKIAFMRFLSDTIYAFIMLFFAMLVDGLTVLIPLFVEKHRESILYAKSNLDILSDHEDILEDLLISCAFNINENDLKVDEDGYYDESIYSKMIESLSDFLKAFEPSPYTSNLGFSKRLAVTGFDSDSQEYHCLGTADTEFGEKYNELISLLLDLKYIKYVSEHEYHLLKLDYYGIKNNTIYKINDDANPKGQEKSYIQNGYFLLKGQFSMWLNESKTGIFNMTKKTRK